MKVASKDRAPDGSVRLKSLARDSRDRGRRRVSWSEKREEALRRGRANRYRRDPVGIHDDLPASIDADAVASLFVGVGAIAKVKR